MLSGEICGRLSRKSENFAGKSWRKLKGLLEVHGRNEVEGLAGSSWEKGQGGP